jgi:hypothetical protein
MNAPETHVVTDAPAPWDLTGRGYISLLRFPSGHPAQEGFLPPELIGRRRPTRFALMMFVDYADSAVGPYHELLFIPGRFPFDGGAPRLSISRIFVSSMDSVVNGRRNWGIPKELAQFDVRYREGGVDQVTLHRNGQTIADLRYSRLPLSLPFTTALVPRSWRTLGQHYDGRTFLYAPEARGWIRPGRLREARVDPAQFPDVGAARDIVTVEVPRFAMRFPVADQL